MSRYRGWLMDKKMWRGEELMNVRNAARAVIIKDDKLLLTKNKDAEGVFYLFPGGGQEHGETLHKALVRECLEEIGAEVEVKELLHIREYIGKNHEHASFDSGVHQLDYFFICHLIKQSLDSVPILPDSHQVGIEWLDIKELSHYRIYPKELKGHLKKYNHLIPSPVYLGDVN